MKKICLVTCIILLAIVPGYSQTAEEKLRQSGITLPLPQKPIANFVNAVRVGNLIYLAGKGPYKPDGTNVTGKLEKN